ncbi:hypothetical protein [Verrucomicrobium sp. BvORR106]|uniref:hypothetical protein n=1 Tax=Verrucomicrobium sp. BvORR106 TaxID=1403819 RepID=UPI002240EF4E|nr:hypothetical protein [Verrucomicrobium sp. BvORR106]
MASTMSPHAAPTSSSATEAGLQMCLAYEHFLNPPTVINPTFTQVRHERIHYGGRWGQQQPRQS